MDATPTPPESPLPDIDGFHGPQHDHHVGDDYHMHHMHDHGHDRDRDDANPLTRANMLRSSGYYRRAEAEINQTVDPEEEFMNFAMADAEYMKAAKDQLMMLNAQRQPHRETIKNLAMITDPLHKIAILEDQLVHRERDLRLAIDIGQTLYDKHIRSVEEADNALHVLKVRFETAKELIWYLEDKVEGLEEDVDRLQNPAAAAADAAAIAIQARADDDRRQPAKLVGELNAALCEFIEQQDALIDRELAELRDEAGRLMTWVGSSDEPAAEQQYCKLFDDSMAAVQKTKDETKAHTEEILKENMRLIEQLRHESDLRQEYGSQLGQQQDERKRLRDEMEHLSAEKDLLASKLAALSNAKAQAVQELGEVSRRASAADMNIARLTQENEQLRASLRLVAPPKVAVEEDLLTEVTDTLRSLRDKDLHTVGAEHTGQSFDLELEKLLEESYRYLSRQRGLEPGDITVHPGQETDFGVVGEPLGVRFMKPPPKVEAITQTAIELGSAPVCASTSDPRPSVLSQRRTALLLEREKLKQQHRQTVEENLHSLQMDAARTHFLVPVAPPDPAPSADSSEPVRADPAAGRRERGVGASATTGSG
eukprot:gnl/Spiro4/25916_TR12909_c0_g1_i1.p1 gnl/Spiro4/25916_TR12909_c0_g1~~gnl/Spiro4/25916_TR12909_c0_g1_i1.p1  ORF type:complete len:596 (-),score=252.44 gnl/Spiro4/25916_TR12909_c0_g1_i1:149-1936(-)